MMGAGSLAIEENLVKKSQKPEVSLEWNNVQIKFRVVQQDFQSEEFELYPNLDNSAPSCRSLMLQKRLQKRTQNTSNTLSGEFCCPFFLISVQLQSIFCSFFTFICPNFGNSVATFCNKCPK